jgi:hypothetical protein
MRRMRSIRKTKEGVKMKQGGRMRKRVEEE